MSDIVKGVIGGSWALVTGWILPPAIGCLLFAYLVQPSLGHWKPFQALGQMSTESRSVTLLVVATILGLVLSALSTPLYRVLEGYLLWPPSLRVRRTQHHLRRRASLEKSVGRFSSPESLALADALQVERFRRYPDVPEQVVPTSLGNAIRRFESYSFNRYLLDSQLCWNHLRAAAPDSAVKEVDNARAGVDFFVCLIYVLGLLLVADVVAFFAPSPHLAALAITPVIAALAAVAAYRAAIQATDAWDSAVRAMVDSGRVPLASSLGLRLPDTVAAERSMWLGLGWFLSYPYDSKVDAYLDPYRGN